jgi:hypothetical protein
MHNICTAAWVDCLIHYRVRKRMKRHIPEGGQTNTARVKYAVLKLLLLSFWLSLLLDNLEGVSNIGRVTKRMPRDRVCSRFVPARRCACNTFLSPPQTPCPTGKEHRSDESGREVTHSKSVLWPIPGVINLGTAGPLLTMTSSYSLMLSLPLSAILIHKASPKVRRSGVGCIKTKYSRSLIDYDV